MLPSHLRSDGSQRRPVQRAVVLTRFGSAPGLTNDSNALVEIPTPASWMPSFGPCPTVALCQDGRLPIDKKLLETLYFASRNRSFRSQCAQTHRIKPQANGDKTLILSLKDLFPLRTAALSAFVVRVGKAIGPAIDATLRQ
jgi:hypothetical protein